MSNFDLPPLMGFDLHSPLRGLGGQDPFRARLENGVGPIGERAVGGPGAASEPGGFEALLNGSLGSVDELQDDVRNKTLGLALGEDVEIHDVMLASAKSEVALNLMLEVRNKLVDAWEKLSRSAV